MTWPTDPDAQLQACFLAALVVLALVVFAMRFGEKCYEGNGS
jgi:hypothetical protein